MVRKWIHYHDPHILRTPLQSQNTNSIENFLARIVTRLCEHKITNKQILNQKNLDFCNCIERSIILKEVECMRNRLNNVIWYKGGPTVYYKLYN